MNFIENNIWICLAIFWCLHFFDYFLLIWQTKMGMEKIKDVFVAEPSAESTPFFPKNQIPPRIMSGKFLKPLLFSSLSITFIWIFSIYISYLGKAVFEFLYGGFILFTVTLVIMHLKTILTNRLLIKHGHAKGRVEFSMEFAARYSMLSVIGFIFLYLLIFIFTWNYIFAGCSFQFFIYLLLHGEWLRKLKGKPDAGTEKSPNLKLQIALTLAVVIAIPIIISLLRSMAYFELPAWIPAIPDKWREYLIICYFIFFVILILLIFLELLLGSFSKSKKTLTTARVRIFCSLFVVPALILSLKLEWFLRDYSTENMPGKAQPVVSALNSYKAARGNYPPRLDDLVPQFISTIPLTRAKTFAVIDYETDIGQNNFTLEVKMDRALEWVYCSCSPSLKCSEHASDYCGLTGGEVVKCDGDWALLRVK